MSQHKKQGVDFVSKEPLKLSILTLILIAITLTFPPLLKADGIKEDAARDERLREFERKLEKLTEDVERIMERTLEESEEMKELRKRVEELTGELGALRGEPTYNAASEKSEPSEPKGEHLYFEGLGHNENLPARAVSLERLRVGIWLQYRLMYNASNIPGPSETGFGSAESYDFIRQRARIGLDIRPFENVGGYAQLEFRGGLGVGPDISDPRAGIDFNNVAFNRLEGRGLRYAYIYASPIKEATLVAGILPSSDYLGDTQFSADWDFNVGGVAITGEIGSYSYRLSYLRLIEGLGFNSLNELGEDAHLIITDLTRSFLGSSAKVGVHLYYLRNDIDEPTVGEFQEAWMALSGNGKVGAVSINGFTALNVGKFYDSVSLPQGLTIPEGSHQGIAMKGEASAPIFDLPHGPFRLSGQLIYASGDSKGKTERRFNTIEGLVGTQGYWGYTHIFTANGPSDVNDFGLDIGNTRLGGGAGLITAQVKVNIPLHRLVGAELEGGSFWSAKSRAGNRYMGSELGGMLTVVIVKPLILQAGFAYARLGGFFESLILGDERLEKNIYELFSRLQLEF